MVNEYGTGLDRNGYAPSLLTQIDNCCYRCCRSGMKLDRHEVFNASNRQNSKAFGAWCLLCRDCHKFLHSDAKARQRLQSIAQETLMQHYRWSIEDFRQRFGKNYL